MTTNEHLTVTRRGLVKAGGVVVGLAGAGMLAAQAHADEAPETAAEEKPSFLTDVEIDDSKIVETVEVDADQRGRACGTSPGSAPLSLQSPLRLARYFSTAITPALVRARFLSPSAR